jgi:hypothetical protein
MLVDDLGTAQTGWQLVYLYTCAIALFFCASTAPCLLAWRQGAQQRWRCCTFVDVTALLQPMWGPGVVWCRPQPTCGACGGSCGFLLCLTVAAEPLRVWSTKKVVA